MADSISWYTMSALMAHESTLIAQKAAQHPKLHPQHVFQATSVGTKTLCATGEDLQFQHDQRSRIPAELAGPALLGEYLLAIPDNAEGQC
ncbi:hypothetical protein VTO42DRAFT_5508 [Malbranchea cinnamomea]